MERSRLNFQYTSNFLRTVKIAVSTQSKQHIPTNFPFSLPTYLYTQICKQSHIRTNRDFFLLLRLTIMQMEEQPHKGTGEGYDHPIHSQVKKVKRESEKNIIGGSVAHPDITRMITRQHSRSRLGLAGQGQSISVGQ